MVRSFFLVVTFLFAQESPYILVLGTAQDAGYPQAHCKKECCQKVKADLSLKRFVSSMALIDPKTNDYWLFDATPDITEQMELVADKTGVHKLPAGIFLTHAHIGHYTGLMYLGREVIGAKNVPVYVMPRMQDFLKSNGPWSQLVSLGNIKLMPIQDNMIITLTELIDIIPLEVPHRDEFSETVGYKMIVGNKSAFFLPDIDKWEKWNSPITDVIKSVDLAFLDGSFYDGDELPGRDMSQIPHPFIVESLEVMKNLNRAERNKVHFIHFNHTNKLLHSDSNPYKNTIKLHYNIAEQNRAYSLE